MTKGGWIDPLAYGRWSHQYLGHTFRYHLARGYLEPNDRVVDVACGCGYGSQLMAPVCQEVIGIDADERAIQLAQQKYPAPNVTYRVQDIYDGLPECSVLVSFETIEHLEDPVRAVQMFRQAARRLIILSTPVVPTVGINPSHLHDFTEDQVIQMCLGGEWRWAHHIRQGPYMVIVVFR